MATKDTKDTCQNFARKRWFFWIISLCILSFLSWDNWNIKVPYFAETRKYFTSLQKVAKTRNTTIYQLVFSRSLLKYLKRFWVNKWLVILKTHFLFFIVVLERVLVHNSLLLMIEKWTEAIGKDQSFGTLLRLVKHSFQKICLSIYPYIHISIYKCIYITYNI